MIDSLYHLYIDANVNLNEQVVSAVSQKRSKDEFNYKYLSYYKLGHFREDRTNRLKNDGILDLVKSESILTCESCLQGKKARLPFMGQRKKIIELLALVHTDVCDPFDVQVRDGYSYFIIFTDDLS